MPYIGLSGVAPAKAYGFGSLSEIAGQQTFEWIATASITSGTASFIEITGIPQTYTHLQLRTAMGSNSSDWDGISMQLNGDTGNNYRTHWLYYNGQTQGTYGYGVNPGFTAFGVPGTSANTQNYTEGGILDILDYSNTSKTKTVKYFGGFDKNLANTDSYRGAMFLISGNWNNTAAVTSIRIYGTTFARSVVRLYGIKEYTNA